MSALTVTADMSALAHNFSFLRERVGDFYAVVKCNAYGHGLESCVRTLTYCGCSHFAVAYADEAYRVRELAPRAEILLLSRADNEDITRLCKENITLTVFSAEYAKMLKNIDNARVHLKIETAMNRSGVRFNELSSVIRELSERVCGAYTHFPRSYDKDGTVRSLMLFSECAENIESMLGRKIIKHAAASDSALNIPETRLDISRIGIALYGVGGSELVPVMSVNSRVIHIHTARKGEFVGYGEACLCESDRIIATVSGGYSDGIPRSGVNSLTARINGFEVKLCGYPCMDRMMLDVTPIFENGKSVSVGDCVLFFGRDKNISETARECKTIPYEIMTSLGRNN